MTGIQRLILALWVLVIVTVILIPFTPLEFANKVAANTMILFAVFGFPWIKWISTRDVRKRARWKKWGLSLLIIAITCLIIIELFSWGGGYKTQDVVYRKVGNPEVRIEYQMEDIGALGYNKRTVKIVPFISLIQYTTIVSLDDLNTIEWERVDENVNELGLRGG